MLLTDFVATVHEGKDVPSKMTVVLTMAVSALLKGHTATIILLIDAVQYGLPGAADGLEIGEPFKPMAELLKKYLDHGGRIVLCRSCLAHNGYKDEQIDPRFEIITAPDVVELLMHAQGSLQL